jgi:hypothetical protein
LVLIVGLSLRQPAAAQPTAISLTDLQLVGRVMHFLLSAPTGGMNVAIVYDGADPQSMAEAQHAARLMGDGLQVGAITLHPVLVEQSHLATAADYSAMLATVDVRADVLRAAMQAHHVPCLTTHTDQVKASDCLVAVRSQPAVSIVLNQAAAASAGVRFAIAFRMMVHEL